MITAIDNRGIIQCWDNGNIAQKSDVGAYTYSSNKPHFVTDITQNSNSMIHPFEQEITYNPFQKTATVEEDTYLYTITYGTDRQRKKTVLKNNNAIVETTIYSGCYEKQTAGGSTKELHYIPTPAQSFDFAAAYITELFNPEEGAKRMDNHFKIIGGLFKTDGNRTGFWRGAGQLLSRWTWESPQTIAGLI